MSLVRPLGGRLPPENMHFWGVFRAIFKTYLVSQFRLDSEIAYDFANFRAISNASRARIYEFRPISGFMGLRKSLLGVSRTTIS